MKILLVLLLTFNEVLQSICFVPQCRVLKPSGLSYPLRNQPSSSILLMQKKDYSGFKKTKPNSNNNNNNISNALGTLTLNVNNWKLGRINQFKLSLQDAKANPLKYLSIPVSAAIIGYITNWLGVKMLFYPIEWRGIPFYKWENQPLGIIGWQGIVPAKRVYMATRLVDITITKLIDVPKVFQQLNPKIMSNLLLPSIRPSLPSWIPSPISAFFLKRTCRDVVQNAQNCFDMNTLVVKGLADDPKMLGQFFQKVARKELDFLVDSGFGFGFLLGLIQMLQWMIFPADWTLVAGGALVGYITNWIALKWIFEPLNPTKFGPFIIQGMFLKRQKEVSIDFCTYLCDKVIISKSVWELILNGPKAQYFRQIVSRNIPLPTSSIQRIIQQLRKVLLGTTSSIGTITTNTAAGVASVTAASITQPPSHPLHAYIDKTLNLKNILIDRMNKLSPAEFEKIIHPVFQEDEMTLILAGAVLGALSGGLQWYANILIEKREKNKLLEKELKEKNLNGNDTGGSGSIAKI